jgi:hypothetical protein
VTPRARIAGGRLAIWTDTLLRAEGRPSVMAAEMFRRSEHLFVLVADRAK